MTELGVLRAKQARDACLHCLQGGTVTVSCTLPCSSRARLPIRRAHPSCSSSSVARKFCSGRPAAAVQPDGSGETLLSLEARGDESIVYPVALKTWESKQHFARNLLARLSGISERDIRPLFAKEQLRAIYEKAELADRRFFERKHVLYLAKFAEKLLDERKSNNALSINNATIPLPELHSILGEELRRAKESDGCTLGASADGEETKAHGQEAPDGARPAGKTDSSRAVATPVPFLVKKDRNLRVVRKLAFAMEEQRMRRSDVRNNVDGCTSNQDHANVGGPTSSEDELRKRLLASCRTIIQEGLRSFDEAIYYKWSRPKFSPTEADLPVGEDLHSTGSYNSVDDEEDARVPKADDAASSGGGPVLVEIEASSSQGEVDLQMKELREPPPGDVDEAYFQTKEAGARSLRVPPDQVTRQEEFAMRKIFDAELKEFFRARRTQEQEEDAGQRTSTTAELSQEEWLSSTWPPRRLRELVAPISSAVAFSLENFASSEEAADHINHMSNAAAGVVPGRGSRASSCSSEDADVVQRRNQSGQQERPWSTRSGGRPHRRPGPVMVPENINPDWEEEARRVAKEQIKEQEARLLVMCQKKHLRMRLRDEVRRRRGGDDPPSSEAIHMALMEIFVETGTGATVTAVTDEALYAKLQSAEAELRKRRALEQVRKNLRVCVSRRYGAVLDFSQLLQVWSRDMQQQLLIEATLQLHQPGNAGKDLVALLRYQIDNSLRLPEVAEKLRLLVHSSLKNQMAAEASKIGLAFDSAEWDEQKLDRVANVMASAYRKTKVFDQALAKNMIRSQLVTRSDDKTTTAPAGHRSANLSLGGREDKESLINDKPGPQRHALSSEEDFHARIRQKMKHSIASDDVY
ncbi:unnamed protein product [Amoebophrya sp. A120]|nr:unnamed protein product [Amoebophrya sp. A120]|eukprot:GSA120T00017334001.1